MKEKNFLEITKILKKLCHVITKKYNSNVIFSVYQLLNKEKELITPYKIIEFYNKNYIENKDFIHIPDYNKVIENINYYPIIIAYNKKNMEILGISTLEYHENKNKNINSYFPQKETKYFSITGILTNINNRNWNLKGIGIRIYEIELYAVFLYQKNKRNIKLICEIDCRNICSIKALVKANENLHNDFEFNKKLEFKICIIGYYLLINKVGKILESPTFVIEINLDLNFKNISQKKCIEYIKTDNVNFSLLNTLSQFLDRNNITFLISKTKNLDNQYVFFVKLNRQQNQQGNGTPRATVH